MKTVQMLALLACGVGLGGAAVYAWMRPARDAVVVPAAQHYTCPMHAEIDVDYPGTCPICGMDLVPRDAPKDASTVPGLATVHIDPTQQQRIGLRLVEVQRGPL